MSTATANLPIPSIDVQALVSLYHRAVTAAMVMQNAIAHARTDLTGLVETRVGGSTSYPDVPDIKAQSYNYTTGHQTPDPGPAYMAAAKRAFWNSVISRTNMTSVLSAAKLSELRAQIGNGDMPEPSVENVYALLHAYREQRQDMFVESVVGVYQRLSRHHCTNADNKLTAKMIFNGVMGVYTHGGYTSFTPRDQPVEILNDLSKALAVLASDPMPDRVNNSWYGRLSDATRGKANATMAAEDDYLRVKLFKNGNAHIWVKDPALLDKINMVLGSNPSLAGVRECRRG